MRRFAGPALLVVVALAAGGCDTAGDEGRTASRRMDAAGVTRLEVDSGFDVRVGLGQPEAVTVTYDADLAELVDVAVDGTTLRVGLRPRDVLGGRPTPRAEVTIGRLDEVRVAGGSTVTVAGPVRGRGCSSGSRAAAGWPPTSTWTGPTPPSPAPRASSSAAPPAPSRWTAREPARWSWPGCACTTWTSSSPGPVAPPPRPTGRSRPSSPAPPA